MSIFQSAVRILPLLLWVFACAMGGFWITRALFRLHPHEELAVGVVLGLLIATYLINFLGRVLPFPIACWAGSGILLITGLLLNFPRNKSDVVSLLKFEFSLSTWIVLTLMILIFWGIGNGLGLLDEYPILPLISQMAGGDLPPHFALDPNVIYNYHYFSFLFSAQLMRLGNLFPWTGLDLQQAIFLTFSMFLLGLWVFRITRNRIAGICAGIFYFLSGGTRWLMLFLPQSMINLIDKNIERMGSGLNSGATLQAALSGSWAARGTGPYLIPFAYANGFNSSFAIGLGYIFNLTLIFLLILLLTFKRWKNWGVIVIYALLLASLELTNEVTYAMFLLGFLVLLIAFAIRNRTIKLPIELIYLLVAVIISGVMTLFQGGVISGVFQGLITHTPNVAGEGSSFHNVSFFLAFPPGFVDAHLGFLSFFNPIQLLVLLFEIGPMIVLVGPTLLWGYRALKSERWMEAALIGMIIVSLGLAFILMSFKSSSLGALSRAQNSFLFVVRIFAVPILILWLSKKQFSKKIMTVVLIAVTIFGGIAIISLEMLALQKPILSTYIEPLDARIMKEFWNKLDTDYWVLDAEPIRDAVLFGRPTNAAITWFELKPGYLALVNNPDPKQMVKEGYGYLYSDGKYIKSLPDAVSNRLNDPCIKSLADFKDDFGGERILLDVRACG